MKIAESKQQGLWKLWQIHFSVMLLVLHSCAKIKWQFDHGQGKPSSDFSHNVELCFLSQLLKDIESGEKWAPGN